MQTPVIVLDDQALVREALVALLSAALPAGAEVSAAGSLAEAAPRLLAVPGCVLLISVDACGSDTGLQAVRAGFPQVRVVALAATETRDGVLRCLSAGAHGFVARSAPSSELVRAVQVVQAGGVHVPAGLAGAGGDDGAAPRRDTAPVVRQLPGQLPGQLTGRQRDVLMLMAEGRSTKDIARTLDLAVSTIKVHLAAVYRAVGARNRVEALCRAGLLPQQRLAA